MRRAKKPRGLLMRLISSSSTTIDDRLHNIVGPMRLFRGQVQEANDRQCRARKLLI